ncbi:non-ribosomal peptide synthetase [Streptomyces sp. AC627_RSS907]|uniref:non-ribosomal peptide synthetase n=1 Tax=Streptomyces sp. AC627_RSS907 TaxID=2823684 RepID=UPI001C216F58|nr:non-ribosomal peptide synthetase [Streptomyces sp. AC627_RSS907]
MQHTLPTVRPASFAQQRLWFLSQLPGAKAAYNESIAYALTGPLDRGTLTRSFDALTDRHETLRTRLVAEAGGVQQHIDPPETGFALTYEDLTDADDPAARLAARQRDECTDPFDLASGPLGRGRLLHLGAEHHVLLLTFHHCIYDGASMNVMMREVGLVYRALLDGTPVPLPVLATQYTDHVEAQQRALLDGSLTDQEEYWKKALRDAPPVLELPYDGLRPAEQDYDGGRVEFRLDADTTAALRRLAREHRATLFVAALTGWAMLLSRLSGQTDIVVGTPVAGRRGPGSADAIGFFVNSLPIRIDLSGAPTGTQALARTRTAVREALAHQDVPLERIVELVNPPRSASHTPLFQTMLAWAPDRVDLLHIPGVEARPLPITTAPAKFDLTLSATESQGMLTAQFDYATALIGQTTARRWADHLKHLLTDLARHPDRDIRDLDIMTPDERAQLFRSGDATAAVPSDATAASLRAADDLASLFELQARLHPTRTAVADRDGALDYATLEDRANRLAHALTARGVRPGDAVGLHAHRTCRLVTGILGILKAGAVYVPFDPQQPPDRLTGMAQDAACSVILSDHGPHDRPADWLDLHAVETESSTGQHPPPDTGRVADRTAYVIFTSGSTGRPKGVAVQHRSVLNLFAAWHERMGTAPGDIGSAWSSIGFDASIHELLLPLTTGGAVHIVPEELRGDPAALLTWMRERQVSQAFLPPAYVKWIDEDPAARLRDLPLRTLLTGVESLTEAALHRMTQHLPGLRICFGYGPTEATLYSTAYYTPRPLERPCPIGRPLPGTRLYILDGRMRPVPPGVIGEIYLGGASLARGYLGRSDLTEERFLPDPFVPGERVYRTGDLGRWDQDGQAHYAGRADDQVKLRGFRVEPAEIEAALMALPGVREAVVLTDLDPAGQPRLVAAVGKTGTSDSGDDLRAALARRLPEYMIPATVLGLESLPLNRSGKADRAEVLRLVHEHTTARVNTASPRDHVEHTLYRIWHRILLHPDIGVSDNFFDVGGTSLSAIKMAHEVTEAFGRHLPVAEVMVRPTIEALGTLLREDGRHHTSGSVIEFRTGTGPRVVCVHPAGGTAFCYLPLASFLPEHVALHGIQSPGVNPGEDVLPTVEAMAETYLRMLEPLGDGPVVLTGLSYGGVVAHEMGRLLGRSGRQDVSVVLLDTQASDDPSAREGITEVDAAEFRDKLVRFNGMYPGIDDAQVDRYFRIYNHNRLTARDHVPAPSPVRLVLAQAVPDGTDTPLHAEIRDFWRRRAQGAFHVETMKCDHWEILEGDSAARVGALITAELARLSAESGVTPAPADSVREGE